MDILLFPERAYEKALSLFKKGLAWCIFHFATFLNTLLGRITAVVTLLCIIAAGVYYADIFFYPMLISTFGALWRRALFYIVWRRLKARHRRMVSYAGYLLKRKWGAIPFWTRVAIQCTLGVAIGMWLLNWLHIWNVAAYITAILPIPVFVEIYLGDKLPRILSAFVQRQGLGKLVFDGGWQLVPPEWRENATKADRLMTRVIKRPGKGREHWQRALDRLERLRQVRRRRVEEKQAESLRLEKELAALE